MELSAFFAEHPRVALAFSGGVDSAYLLYAASRYAKHVRAYYVKTPFQPAFELADAQRLAQELGAELTVLELDILKDCLVTANDKNRCYYCKKQIFSLILQAAKADGFSVLLDGTNADDKEDDRPGFRALRELSVRSPLRECGLTKSEIRRLSREAGLFTHDKPAYACLATRITSGETITAEKLCKTEAAEAFLHSLGFRDFRVRMLGDAAKLQIKEEQLSLLLNNRAKILEKFSGLYSAVLLDLEGRK